MLGVDEVYRRLFERYGPQHWWPGETPFEVMVGAVLTQNTAWSNVERAIDNLKGAQMLTPEAIVAADPVRLAEVIRPSGYFNVKAKRLANLCRWLIEVGGETTLAARPTSALREALLAVNGIGYETADDILLYAFDREVFVVDAYTKRLFSRLGHCAAQVGYEALRLQLEAALRDAPARVPLYNEYHALIVAHAKVHCLKRARCSGCPLHHGCLNREG